MSDINKPLTPISRLSFFSLLKKYCRIIFSIFFVSSVIFFLWFLFSDPVFEVAVQKKQSNQTYNTKEASQTAVKENDSKKYDGIVVRDPLQIDQKIANNASSYLPDEDLIEKTTQGSLPIIGKDGRTSFEVYARSHTLSTGLKLAIVVGGIGISQTNSLKAIEELPADVTLAFAPHGNSLGHWMKKARMAGHEFLVQIPMEPYGYPNVYPGLNTLTVDTNEDTNIQHLRWALSRTTNYIGVMNYMGARFMSDYDSIEIFMKEVSQRGLLFFDDGTSPQSVSSIVAMKNRVPFAKADIVLDDVLEKSAILKKLEALENLARSKGKAIGVASSFDLSIDILREWIEKLYSRNIQIVPLSSLMMNWKDKISLAP